MTEVFSKMYSKGKPWSHREDDIIRKGYPFYFKLQKQLPHRTLAALKHRAQTLGVARQRHIWTNHEVQRLCAACANKMCRNELLALFPKLQPQQVIAKAKHMKIALPWVKPTIIGVPAIDEIRARALALGINLIDLDRRAGTGCYFQQVKRRPILKHLVKAAAYLGGEISITWSEL